MNARPYVLSSHSPFKFDLSNRDRSTSSDAAPVSGSLRIVSERIKDAVSHIAYFQNTTDLPSLARNCIRMWCGPKTIIRGMSSSRVDVLAKHILASTGRASSGSSTSSPLALSATRSGSPLDGHQASLKNPSHRSFSSSSTGTAATMASVPQQHFDIIVVGTGSGASKLGTPAKKLGFRVAVVEHGFDVFPRSSPGAVGELLTSQGPYHHPGLGGTCLLRGCIPSKMLIHPADVATELKHEAKRLFLDAEFRGVDYEKLVEETTKTVDSTMDCE